MNKQKIMNITLLQGDVLAKINILDKLGNITTTDIARSRSIAQVVKISDTDSFGKKQTIKIDDYILIPKFHQITDKLFKTDDNEEFVIVNDQDIVIVLKNIK